MQVRVLVFEADEGIRELMVEALRASSVLAAGRSGPPPRSEEVRLADSRETTDLVVIDLGMADDGGLALAQRLVYAGMDARDISLIASAWPPIAYRTARVLGLQTFQKPFPMSDLVDWVSGRRGVARKRGRVLPD
jgi:DNA-binding NtrC family response regulator